VILERGNGLTKTTYYYKTGEIQKTYEYVGRELFKRIDYYKTGEVQKVYEYENDGAHKRSWLSKQTYYYKTGEIERFRDFNDLPWYAVIEIQAMIIYLTSALLLCLTIWRTSNTTTSSTGVLFTFRILGFVAFTPLIVGMIFSGGGNFATFYWFIFALPTMLLWVIIEVWAMQKSGGSVGLGWVVASCFLIYFITNIFFMLQWK
jgi:hypothetical protein